MVLAVRVGIDRGSIVVRFRPVGKTSSLPRLGAPEGPGPTRRPSSAASSALSSYPALLLTAASICRRLSALTCDRFDQRGLCLALGSTPEHVQPVAYAEFLDIAQPGVEFGHGIARRLIR